MDVFGHIFGTGAKFAAGVVGKGGAVKLGAFGTIALASVVGTGVVAANASAPSAFHFRTHGAGKVLHLSVQRKAGQRSYVSYYTSSGGTTTSSVPPALTQTTRASGGTTSSGGGQTTSSSSSVNSTTSTTSTPTTTGGPATTTQVSNTSSGGVFNVVNFGADPTGTRDSSVAIASAISAAEAANNDAEVYFPAGHYIVKPASPRMFDFIISAPIRIVGAGQGATTIEDEIGVKSGYSVPNSMFEIVPAPGTQVGGGSGTLITGLTLDASSFDAGTPIMDYANNTVIENLMVYGPTSTNTYNPNQFGVRVIAVCNPTTRAWTFRTGNVVRNVTIFGNGAGGNTELDISCQQNATVTGVTIHGNGMDVFYSENDSISNAMLVGGSNGSLTPLTFAVTGSKNITLTNITTNGEGGAITQDTSNVSQNIVINHEVMLNTAASLKIGDSVGTVVENSSLGGVVIDPLSTLSGVSVSGSSYGHVYCWPSVTPSALSGISCS